jgi:hypothetical protein
MSVDLKKARLLGVLFLLPFLAYGLGDSLVTTVLGQPDFLLHLLANKPRLLSGIGLLLLNSIIVVGIGALLFPVLETHNRPIALVYLSTRIAEAIILIMGIISLLSLLTIGEQYLKADPTQTTYLETLTVVARQTNFLAYQIAMLVLGVGSTGFCYVLLTGRLVPRLLAMLGLAGYVLLALGAVLELAGYPVGWLLSIPGGLFELSFGSLLLIRGLAGTLNRPNRY